MLAFDDRKSVAAGHEMAAVVGRVELAPEVDVPAGGIAQRRDGEGDRVQDVDVARGSNVGHGDLVAAQLFEQGPGEQ